MKFIGIEVENVHNKIEITKTIRVRARGCEFKQKSFEYELL